MVHICSLKTNGLVSSLVFLQDGVFQKKISGKTVLSFFNDFKIRGSWGQTGNDRIDEYQYLTTYGYVHRQNLCF